MPGPNNVPKITPASTAVMGQQIQAIADADPDLFPNGLDIVIMLPGGLQPMGGGHIPVGHMLAILPPAIAKQIRPAMRAQMMAQRPGPGEVKAPGIQ